MVNGLSQSFGSIARGLGRMFMMIVLHDVDDYHYEYAYDAGHCYGQLIALPLLLPFISITISHYYYKQCITVTSHHHRHPIIPSMGIIKITTTTIPGPALGGSFWTMGIRAHFVYLNFILVSLLFIICNVVNRILPKNL